MGRGGRLNSRRDLNRRVRSKDKGSDDSDEDYVISEEENYASEDDFDDFADSCSYLDENMSEESCGGFVEEEEEEEEEDDQVEEVKKSVKPKVRKGSLGNRKSCGKTSRKRKRPTYDNKEDEDSEEEEYMDDDDDDDEEFTVEEDDFLDEEEEVVVRKKSSGNSNRRSNNKKLSRKLPRQKGLVRSRKKRRSTVPKKPSGKTVQKNRRLRKKYMSDDEDEEFDDVDLVETKVVVRERNKKKSGHRKRRYVIPSDSDFVSSESSDHEYTISEEEREQVREARRLCESLKTNLRNSSLIKRIKEENDHLPHQRRKPTVRKGKEKISESKTEVVKQVCGICLTEEDKRRLRGTLNCCSHYFCFTCIMEWSKVESRCPLCKQRFNAITKPERTAAGIDLRSVVIQVPERDQVYQPSEEDLRSYLDPYENVICSECHQGGDDGLMLLCDLCDSSAHTYCVGLGQEVPPGNWYCDGCRPVVLGSSTSQAQDPSPDPITISNNLNNRSSPVVILGEGVDSFSVASPRLQLTQTFGNLSSPRVSLGDISAASPGNGAGASTLTQRRRLHRQIQNIRSFNRLNSMAGSGDGLSPANNLSNNFSNPQIGQRRETVQPARTEDIRGPLQLSILDERLQFNPSPFLENRESFATRLSPLTRQMDHDPSTVPVNGPVNLTMRPQFSGMDSLPPSEQLRQYNSIMNIGPEHAVSSFAARNDFSVAKEQLLSAVKTHLKNSSRDTELDNDTFNEIVRGSMHTVLAACGLDHKSSEVHVVNNTPLSCSHMERVAAGQTSLMKDVCFPCFDSFVKDVVKRIMDTRLSQWLRLGL